MISKFKQTISALSHLFCGFVFAVAAATITGRTESKSARKSPEVHTQSYTAELKQQANKHQGSAQISV